ncbi:MAG: F0F1 ATP synthase subunit epsilon [Rhodospirillales bacterium]|nr:F0F1 ATP synthase subunit epsilon [Rhodospirillales bacterium]
MATFQLELVSPEKLLLSRQVDMVIIPAAEGEMGVLPGHAPMIVALRGGAIRVTDRVTVLADEATPLAEISRAAAEARVAEAEAEYNAAAMASPEKRDAAMTRLLSMRSMATLAQAS